jgi:hypothetical protein
MKRVTLLFVILFAYVQCSQDIKYSEAVELKIKQVENNLAGWVRTQENVLDPLGMKGSSFTQPPEKAKRKLLSTG